MPKIQLGPRVEAHTKDFLNAHFESTNAGAEYALEAFYHIYRGTLREIRGQFSREELRLILARMEGLQLSAAHPGEGFVIKIEDSIRFDRADRDWRVKGDELLAKLGGLSLAQLAMVEVWARGFWKAHPVPDKPEKEAEASKQLREDAKEEWVEQLAA